MEKYELQITSMKYLTSDVVSMWLKADEIARSCNPGQFVSVYVKGGGRLLPRPISICEADCDQGLIRLVFRIVGQGTKEMASYRAGDTIDVLGPLGNGYPLEQINDKETVLIGGGIGIPPMLELAKQIKGQITVVLGYRDSQLFLADEFSSFAKVYVATEDGSVGTKGNVIDCIREHQLNPEIICACGPLPMLKGVKAFGESESATVYLSLEERMACGIGACLGCVCESTQIDGHSLVHNKRICKDGPVFISTEVNL